MLEFVGVERSRVFVADGTDLRIVVMRPEMALLEQLRALQMQLEFLGRVLAEEHDATRLLGCDSEPRP